MINEIKQQLKIKGELYLKIKVQPGAGKNQIIEFLSDGTIKISIKALPTKGKANQELIGFLADKLEINKNNVKIISGFKERIKLVKIGK